MRRLVYALTAFLILAAAGSAAYDQGLLRFAYPRRQAFAVRGIDVSRHQGVIDWRQVANDGVGFAYLKASEGGDLKDPTFVANVRAAQATGLPVGAYHFFTLCRSGADQAANLLAATVGQDLELPLAIDLEYVGNCAKRPDRAAFAADLRDFLGRVEGATARRPIFYVTPKFHQDYLAGAGFDAYGLWVRDVVGGLGEPKPATLWQFADNARVDGIKGKVDLDAFAGERPAFAKWARGGP